VEKSKNERCPTCGEPVESIFDHVDREGMCETPEQSIDRLKELNTALLEALTVIYSQARDTSGVIAEYIAMPCESLRVKFPTTLVRLNARLENAASVIAKAEATP
jgi:hypothetical protein